MAARLRNELTSKEAAVGYFAAGSFDRAEGTWEVSHIPWPVQ